MFLSLELQFLARVNSVQERHLLASLPDDRARQLASVVDGFLRRKFGRLLGRTITAAALCNARGAANIHRELARAADSSVGAAMAFRVRPAPHNEATEHSPHLKTVKPYVLAILVEVRESPNPNELPFPLIDIDPINSADLIHEFAAIFEHDELVAQAVVQGGSGGILPLPKEEWATRYLLSRKNDGLYRLEETFEFGNFLKSGIEVRAAFYSYPAWCSINQIDISPGCTHEGYLSYVRRYRLLELLFIKMGAVFLPVAGCRHGRYLSGIADETPIRDGVLRNDVLTLGPRISFGQLHFELNEYTSEQLGTVYWEAVLQRGTGAVLEHVQFYPLDASGVRAVNRYVEQRTLQLGCECVRHSVELNAFGFEQLEPR